jgi:hypothetical protein
MTQYNGFRLIGLSRGASLARVLAVSMDTTASPICSETPISRYLSTLATKLYE